MTICIISMLLIFFINIIYLKIVLNKNHLFYKYIYLNFLIIFIINYKILVTIKINFFIIILLKN